MSTTGQNAGRAGSGAGPPAPAALPELPVPRPDVMGAPCWGFTGTREGMTPPQAQSLRRKLTSESRIGELHHGDCVGADAQADEIARRIGWRRIAHPPTSPSLWARCGAEIVCPKKPYLERDRNIVDATTDLFAAPRENIEPRGGGSGTWYTIRYALRTGKPVAIYWPDGRVDVRHPSGRPVPEGMDWHPREVGPPGAISAAAVLG